MKKIINDVDLIIDQMIDGLMKANGEILERLEDSTVVARKGTAREGKVGIISGGGSGHEPAHAGYVGEGMLDCAICGSIFTSPTPDQILKAIEKADSGSGVFMVIKNYQGDVMNFEIAQEMAEMEDIKVDSIIVRDDIAIENYEDRRGVAGTIFVHKVLGAMAEEGKSLEEIKAKAEEIVQNIKTIGLATKPCTNPNDGKESFSLEEDEIEMGIGIHGEEGIKKEKIQSADTMSKEMVDRLLEEIPKDKKDYALMVNGMGQTTEMELYLVNNFVSDYLKENSLDIKRTYVGNYMTSMDMAGFSLTLFAVDDQILKYLDREVKVGRR
ncbi:MAG: dihydroxyacetone kinase subunit DhaK [Anaerococcus prevotii]|nr:dihydroxyacetone kinase subunit DhaK [Anaerococcus prevotii]